MRQFNVTGMSCAACQARVEKAVGKVEGVSSCSVSLLTNSMGVEGTASDSEIIAAVEAAGYGASVKGASENKKNDSDVLEDKETPVIKNRLIASLILIIPLMYLSMGHTMWGLPLPSFFSENHIAMGLAQLLLTVAIMVINQKFFVSGFKSLLHGAPNMDTLVSLGSGAAFIYSVYSLFMMTSEGTDTAHYMHELYFESAAMILTLITVGKMLEARSKGRTTDALKSLMRLAPKTATVIRGVARVEVPISEVRVGDTFVVLPGQSIPVDGIVKDGISAVNEAALTGESIPQDKAPGDTVSAATINQSGFLTCEATRVGEDTTLSQIIRMVSDAAATKAPIAKVADKVSGIFVPIVIAIALITTVIWLLADKDIGFALARGISVLVISCPCALGLATPVAIMVGNGVGAKHGILFKTAVSLEETGKAQIVALDKTGTITKGEPEITDILPGEKADEGKLLFFAYMLEKNSEHPLAKAIVNGALTKPDLSETAQEAEKIADFHTIPGKGLSARIGEIDVCGGKREFIADFCEIPPDALSYADTLANEGKTPLFFSCGGDYLGVIAVADTIKEDSPGAIRELQNMGIRVVMLTGDNERTAKAIGKKSGVDEVVAGVLPDGKNEVILNLKEKGRVIMVGDGINDAPALTSADIGIAIGAGTDITIDAADIVLMNNRLSDVPAAIRLSRATLRNIHENLFWAFIYNIIGIPLAAGIWIPIFGWTMNPMFGAAAMSLSSFCVVSNALRLNLFKINDLRRDKKIKALPDKALIKKEKTFEITLTVEGMMCEHCEARVENAIKSQTGCIHAKADHQSGKVNATFACMPDSIHIKKAIEDEDYKITTDITVNQT